MTEHEILAALDELGDLAGAGATLGVDRRFDATSGVQVTWQWADGAAGQVAAATIAGALDAARQRITDG
jgi:hypothetical protein